MADTMAASPKPSQQATEESIEMKSRAPSPLSAVMIEGSQKIRYINNLLPAIGYLDLANGLDFPANVWNTNPIPTFAKVLMGLGGSIAILSTAFAVVDLRRSRNNVKFLCRERAWLKKLQTADPQLRKFEQSWLDVNYRELGWEIVDRMLLDICMLIAGILVGAGTLMAIRGDIKAVFNASNLLSGYIGNSFVALYALTNLAWSIFMWKRASRNHAAFKKAKSSIKPETRQLFAKHTMRHKIFAVVNGPTAVISGVASLISATHWPGYVVLIPGIIGSVFANHYWRFKLGYSRDAYQDVLHLERLDILGRVELINDIRAALKTDVPGSINFCDLIAASEKASNSTIVSFLRDYGLYESFLHNLQDSNFAQEMGCADPEQALYVMPELDFRRHSKIVSAVNGCIVNINKVQLRYEERFFAELYGCFCYQDQAQDGRALPAAEAEPRADPEP